jgi:ankyrin repeat protein
LLIEHGADAAAQDKHGLSPLHLASRSGHPEVVQTLLTYGAYPNVRDKSGWTPLHFASQEEHEEVVQLLLSYDENNGALPIASDMKNTN